MRLEEMMVSLEQSIQAKAVQLLLEDYPDSWIPYREKQYYNQDLVNDMPTKRDEGKMFFLNPNLSDKLNDYLFKIEMIMGEKLAKILTSGIVLTDIKEIE